MVIFTLTHLQFKKLPNLLQCNGPAAYQHSFGKNLIQVMLGQAAKDVQNVHQRHPEQQMHLRVLSSNGQQRTCIFEGEFILVKSFITANSITPARTNFISGIKFES